MYKKSQYHITSDFDYNGKYYIAYTCPYFELTDEELILYKISEYSYVAHVFSEEGFKTVEIFPDEQLHWNTNASSLFIDKKIVEIIGQFIMNTISGEL